MMMVPPQLAGRAGNRDWRFMSPALPFLLYLPLVILCSGSASGLNEDGVLLLNFKYTIIHDTLGVMSNWNYDDASPCSWNGVVCGSFPDSSSDQQQQGGSSSSYSSRVTQLILPSSQLLGPISPDLGLLEHLQHLDLSANSLNGTLPDQLFNASELQVLTLAGNEISGGIPDQVSGLRSLQTLNLSDNALTGSIPAALAHLPNLTVLALANNFLAGPLVAGYDAAQKIDLSCNTINGSLPENGVGGNGLRYLNLSTNRLTGGIPTGFASGVPGTATLDISFNNLTGPIPDVMAANLRVKDVEGNPGLCGKPLKNLCAIPSSLSQPPPNGSSEVTGTSPPAFAVMPKVPRNGDSNVSVAQGGAGSHEHHTSQDGGSSGLKPMAIAGIVVGDLAGIGLLFAILSYLYYVKRKKAVSGQQHHQLQGLKPSRSLSGGGSSLKQQQWSSPMVTTEKQTVGALSLCIGKKRGSADSDETSESTGSDSDAEYEGGKQQRRYPAAGSKTPDSAEQKLQKKPGQLVTVDGETELNLDTLLKASAYILGATGSSIVYKAVLADGTSYAVRRIGEGGSADKLREFEGQVRSIAKLRHPNLVRVRGFYWGSDEKLLICDFIPNGSLANISYKRPGSSPFQLRWDARLRIARGVARGLAYLHDKKAVHGNVKPSNILLGSDMEPRIGDLGLDRLTGNNIGESSKPGASFRYFGSKRSTLSQNSLEQPSPSAGASPYGGSSSSHYHAPECFKNLKPSPKWDAYSFGVLLLELLTGRVFSEPELLEWGAGFAAEDRARAVRMADVAIRGELEGLEDALLSCFRLAFGCANVSPQKRPSMKEAVQVLEKMPPFCSSSASMPS